MRHTNLKENKTCKGIFAEKQAVDGEEYIVYSDLELWSQIVLSVSSISQMGMLGE